MVKFIKKLLGLSNQLYEEPVRVEKLAIEGRSLLQIFKYLEEGRIVGLEGLPNDAEAVGVTVDIYNPNRVFLFIKSDTFELVSPGSQIPNMDPLTLHVKESKNACDKT